MDEAEWRSRLAPDWEACPGAVAPYPRLQELWARKSWTMPVVSPAGGSFNTDMGATTADGDEQFGISAFVRDDAHIYRTYGWGSERDE